MHRHTGLEILSGGREYARLAPKLRELLEESVAMLPLEIFLCFEVRFYVYGAILMKQNLNTRIIPE